MKRFAVLFLCCLLLTGCGVEPADPTAAPTVSTPETTAPTDATVPETTPAPLLTYEIYLPNANADGFEVKTVETDQITADSILLELQTHGVLPDTVAINSFGSEGSQLNIDFNQPFADLVSSMGTSGEMMIVGSVVNTYLSAFQADALFFTVNGEILESGHVIYDFPIAFVN